MKLYAEILQILKKLLSQFDVNENLKKLILELETIVYQLQDGMKVQEASAHLMSYMI